MKKIGIIGSGMVAKALGNGFIKHGYEVMLSSRDISKLTSWKEDGGETAHIGSFEDAARFSDIIVLAVKGSAAIEAINVAGPLNLAGKTVIDTTNPLTFAAPEDGVAKYFTSLEESLMEQLQKAFPEINFVKAFNTIGHALMVNPSFSEKPTMFICGNDNSAKKSVSDILELFSWDVADMGKATSARAIEPLCILWLIPGMLYGQWNHAFKMLKN